MKNLKNLGEALNKAELKTINGGGGCHFDLQCQILLEDPYAVCYNGVCIPS